MSTRIYLNGQGLEGQDQGHIYVLSKDHQGPLGL